jgi:crotonobetaine/carnitine-CoA ligase
VGAILVPLNHEQRGTILAALLANAQSALTLVDESGRESIASLPPESAHIGGACRPTWPTVLIRMRARRSRSTRRTGATGPHPLQLGTTGVSKGCVLSHDHLVYTGEEFCRAADMRATDSVYSPGRCSIRTRGGRFPARLSAACAIRSTCAFSASQFWSRATATEATLFDYVGAMIAILLRSPHDPGRSAECAPRSAGPRVRRKRRRSSIASGFRCSNATD